MNSLGNRHFEGFSASNYILKGDNKTKKPAQIRKVDRGIVKILLEKGLNLKEISDRLNISYKTAQNCKKDIKDGKIS